MKRQGMLVFPLNKVKIKESGLTWGVHDKMPLFLALKVCFRVHLNNL